VFELLLHFVESLQNSVNESHLSLFAEAINLKPFIPPNANVLLRSTTFSKESTEQTANEDGNSAAYYN
jgi:hypothetical protein